MSNAEQWVSVHISYFAKPKDHFIKEAIAPLLVSPETTGYFTRHWRRGPHLRINLLVRDEHAETLRDHIHRTLEQGLKRNPSNAILNHARVLEVSSRRADIEGDNGLLEPLYEDNKVYDAPYEPPRAGFSGPQARGFLERFYVATNDNALRIVSDVCRGSTRLGLLFDLFAAAAHNLGVKPPRYSWISMRSHADKFRYAGPESARVSADWDTRYQEQRDHAVRRMLTVQEYLAAPSDDMPVLAQWLEAVRPLYAEARGLVESDQLSFDRPDGEDTDALANLRAALPSPIHQEMLRSREMMVVTDDPRFRTFRILLTLTYAHASRVGMSLAERYLLCHLVASTMEDLTGTSSLDVVQNRAFWDDGGSA